MIINIVNSFIDDFEKELLCDIANEIITYKN